MNDLRISDVLNGLSYIGTIVTTDSIIYQDNSIGSIEDITIKKTVFINYDGIYDINFKEVMNENCRISHNISRAQEILKSAILKYQCCLLIH